MKALTTLFLLIAIPLVMMGIMGCQPQSGDMTTADYKSPSPMQGTEGHLFETGSMIAAADDQVQAQILNHFHEETQTRFKKDQVLKASESFLSAQVRIEKSQIKVHLFGARQKVTSLSGSLSYETGEAQLSATGHNALEIQSGKIICLDQDQSRCLVSVIRLSVGQKQVPVIIVHRKTGAKLLRLNRLGSDSGTAYLFQYFQNVSKQSQNSLKKIEVETSQVIFGKTHIQFKFETHDRHLFGFSGFLVDQNIASLQPLKLSELKVQMPAMQTALHLNLNQLKVMAQDGRGQFDLRILNKGSSGPVEAVDVSLQRHSVSVKALSF